MRSTENGTGDMVTWWEKKARTAAATCPCGPPTGGASGPVVAVRCRTVKTGNREETLRTSSEGGRNSGFPGDVPEPGEREAKGCRWGKEENLLARTGGSTSGRRPGSSEPPRIQRTCTPQSVRRRRAR